ncbi:hypothetical protein ACJJTC_013779 [Scirpophaga incertulas]
MGVLQALKAFYFAVQSSWSKLNILYAEIKSFESRVQILEGESARQQQWARLQNIEIVGVPEVSSEDTQKIAQKIIEHIGVALCPGDIEFAHRVQPLRQQNASHSRTIIARLRHRCTKDAIIVASRKHRGLTAREVGLEGDTIKLNNKIYVNEHLTKNNKSLLKQCKSKALECKFKYVWTKNCRIFVRKGDSTPSIPITTITDLKKVT